MITTPTLFIIGAGASCELGFPSGAVLLQNIAEDLNLRFEFGRQTSGDFMLGEEIKRILKRDNPEGDGQEYLQASMRIRDAAGMGRSIDNVLHQNGSRPFVKLVGKLAIARQILQAEERSGLIRQTSGPGSIDWSVAEKSWLLPFGQILTQDLDDLQVDRIFEHLSVISFNYDRTLEVFLPFALMRAYGINRAHAEKVSASLKIVHPYGSLGSLQWTWEEGELDHLPFGSDASNLEPIAQRLRTFSEQLEDPRLLQRIRKRVLRAKRIVFLGFGYHKQNMDLLTPGSVVHDPETFGTVFREPAPAIAAAKKKVLEMLGARVSAGTPSPRLLDQECAEFLSHHFSPLSS